MIPAQIFSHWKQIRADLLATIDSFTDQELHYAPFEGSWPVGQIMIHIADAEDGWFRYVITKDLDMWPDHYTLENYPTRAAIKNMLREVHAQTEAYLDSLDVNDLFHEITSPQGEKFSLYWIIWHVLEHEIHHRGELSLALGLLGRDGLDV